MDGLVSNAGRQRNVCPSPAGHPHGDLDRAGEPDGRNASLHDFLTASDGEEQGASANYTQNVRSVPHTLTMTAPPSATTPPSAAGVPVPLTVTVVDSLNDPLTYSLERVVPARSWQQRPVLAGGGAEPDVDAGGTSVGDSLLMHDPGSGERQPR
jgi:hypothetical protein